MPNDLIIPSSEGAMSDVTTITRGRVPGRGVRTELYGVYPVHRGTPGGTLPAVRMTTSVAVRTTSDPLNGYVAAVLDETARLLEQQHINAFRAQAYRSAAGTVRGLPRGVDAIVDAEGLAGLHELPAIGQGMARVIHQIATTGHFPLLERLRRGSTRVPHPVLVPGSGP